MRVDVISNNSGMSMKFGGIEDVEGIWICLNEKLEDNKYLKNPQLSSQGHSPEIWRYDLQLEGVKGVQCVDDLGTQKIVITNRDGSEEIIPVTWPKIRNLFTVQLVGKGKEAIDMSLSGNTTINIVD